MIVDMTKIGATQTASFKDVGRIDVYSESTGSGGGIVKAYAPGSNIDCGFVGSGGGKTYKDSFVVDSELATVRISRDVVVSKQDHFVLVSKSGVELDNEMVFKIESIQPGIGIWVLKVKNVDV